MKTTDFTSLLITPSIDRVYIHALALAIPAFNVDWIMYRYENEQYIRLFLDTLSPFGKKLLLNIPFTSPQQALRLSCEFGGVHLKSHLLDYIPPLKTMIKQDKIIGYSAHSVEELMYALHLGAHYCTLSPIFPTPNKGAPLGLEVFEHIPCHLRQRVIALGGITPSHTEVLRALGLGGFAGISCFQP